MQNKIDELSIMEGRNTVILRQCSDTAGIQRDGEKEVDEHVLTEW